MIREGGERGHEQKGEVTSRERSRWPRAGSEGASRERKLRGDNVNNEKRDRKKDDDAPEVRGWRSEIGRGDDSWVRVRVFE